MTGRKRRLRMSVFTEPRGSQNSRGPLADLRPPTGMKRWPTDDELLLLATQWVKETRRSEPDFVTEVALAFDMLEGALHRELRLRRREAHFVRAS